MEDFFKFCGLLRISELYNVVTIFGNPLLLQVSSVECSDILAEYCCIIQMVQCQTCMKYNPKVYQRSTKFNQEELPTLNIYKKNPFEIFSALIRNYFMLSHPTQIWKMEMLMTDNYFLHKFYKWYVTSTWLIFFVYLSTQVHNT